jgi:hypothetical protein
VLYYAWDVLTSVIAVSASAPAFALHDVLGAEKDFCCVDGRTLVLTSAANAKCAIADRRVSWGDLPIPSTTTHLRSYLLSSIWHDE